MAGELAAVLTIGHSNTPVKLNSRICGEAQVLADTAQKFQQHGPTYAGCNKGAFQLQDLQCRAPSNQWHADFDHFRCSIHVQCISPAAHMSHGTRHHHLITRHSVAQLATVLH
jgi:hypothetical protein